jgi:WD40 repeat protein
VFAEGTIDFDIASVDLTTAAMTPLLATNRSENAPAWAANGSAMVYLTDRNGAPEIWLHKPSEGDRPLVANRDFPGDNTRFLMGPALSPDGNRVVYRRTEKVGRPRLWMSAISGGSPVELVKDGKGTEHAGAWSPDGVWFAFWVTLDGKTDLYKVKTSGQAIPELVKANISRTGNWVSAWSPTGEWILHSDAGVKLISTDGKTERQLSDKTATVCAFSRDGATVYCIRDGDFISIPTAGGPEKHIGSIPVANRPSTNVTPSLRMTLTPDGKSFTYSILKQSSNLWMLSGIE